MQALLLPRNRLIQVQQHAADAGPSGGGVVGRGGKFGGGEGREVFGFGGSWLSRETKAKGMADAV
jgi:hypothetical protein